MRVTTKLIFDRFATYCKSPKRAKVAEEKPEENEDEDEWESEERKRKEDLADRDAFVERMKARDAERTKVRTHFYYWNQVSVQSDFGQLRTSVTIDKKILGHRKTFGFQCP